VTATVLAIWIAYRTGWLNPRLQGRCPPRSTLVAWDIGAGVAILIGGLVAGGLVVRSLGLGSAVADDSATPMDVAWLGLVSQMLGYGPPAGYFLVRRAFAKRAAAATPAKADDEAAPTFPAPDAESAPQPPGVVRSLGLGAALGVGGLLMVVLFNLVVTQLLAAMGVETPLVAHEALVLMQEAGPAALAVLIVSAVVMAPIFEELIFRGLVQSALLGELGARRRWAVVWIASGLFAVVHVGAVAPMVLPGLLLLGLIFGVIYERTGRTLPAIVAHAVFNAANVAYVVWVMPLLSSEALPETVGSLV